MGTNTITSNIESITQINLNNHIGTYNR